MKVFKTVVLLCILCMPVFANAKSASQQDEVTLTVSADGATKDDAVKTALRSAIEQAYGTFVSANTAILNDELVKDEIVTVASGNVKSYSEIASETMPNGRTYVTLRATVSVSKLIKYAQSKGAETEFAGATFGMNLKMKELNKKNDQKVLENMLTQLKSIPDLFDYELELKEPTMKQGEVCVEGFISLIINSNTQLYYDILMKTLLSLSLSENERKEYESMNIPYYAVKIQPSETTRKIPKGWEKSDDTYIYFYLRNPFDINLVLPHIESSFEERDILSTSAKQFVLSDNVSSPTKLKYNITSIAVSRRTPYYLLIKRQKPLKVLMGMFAGINDGVIDPIDEIALDNIGTVGTRIGSGTIEIYIPVDDISKYSNFRIERTN